jgi:hypothetical protein
VPLFALEYYGTVVAAKQDDQGISEALFFVVKNICGVTEPVEADFTYLVSRLKEAEEKAASAKESADHISKGKKSFGYALNTWLEGTDAIEMLSKMTNYDMAQVEQMYCKLDFSETQELLKSYVEAIQAQALINYECALYAAGGHYEGDKKSNSNVKQYDANSKEGMAALQGFGFGNIDLGTMGIDIISE